MLKEISTSHGHFTKPNEIAEAIVNHFIGLFNYPKTPNADSFNLLPRKLVSSPLAEYLVKPFSNEEIKAVVFALPTSSTLGPDGYIIELYKSS